MKLENTFSIAVPVEDAWKVLLDIDRVAPCVPGATITSSEGDEFHGKVKVKLGPIALSYSGIIAFRSKDEDAKVAVLEGSGREARGNGTASAVVTCRLVESAAGTDVLVETDLDITGKPAQFGRGALAEVAGKLIGQFADNLAAEITSSADPSPLDVSAATEPDTTAESITPPSSISPPSSPVVAAPAAQSAEPIDLLGVAGAGRAAMVAVPVFIAVLLAVAVFLRRAASAS